MIFKSLRFVPFGTNLTHFEPKSSLLLLRNSKSQPKDSWSNLCAALYVFAHAEANEGWVGHLDQDVVHTVNMDELGAAFAHVLQDLLISQSVVEAAIAVWGDRVRDQHEQL